MIFDVNLCKLMLTYKCKMQASEESRDALHRSVLLNPRVVKYETQPESPNNVQLLYRGINCPSIRSTTCFSAHAIGG